MSPLLIVGLVVVVLVVAVFLFGLTPDPNRRRAPRMLKRRRRWTRWLPIVPLLGAIASLAFAFTGFRFSLEETSSVAVLVMDVSDSMKEADISPTRLAASQDAARSFLGQLPSDVEVGLVTFAGRAALVVAPTTDRDEVMDEVRAFETAAGTHIWDGLTTGLDAIQDRRAGTEAPAAVLLMSDGRDTGSDAAASDVAGRAVSMAVPVYGVLLGQPSGERAANIQALELVSEPTGGETFTAATADQLTERFRTLGTRFSVELAADPSTTPLVAAAIALVVLAGILLVVMQR